MDSSINYWQSKEVEAEEELTEIGKKKMGKEVVLPEQLSPTVVVVPSLSQWKNQSEDNPISHVAVDIDNKNIRGKRKKTTSTYCCKEKCFCTSDHLLKIEGIACKICYAYGRCMCVCKTYTRPFIPKTKCVITKRADHCRYNLRFF